MSTNLSIYAIPVAWLLCLVPHMYAVAHHDAKSPQKKVNLTQPRSFVASLDQNQALDKATKDTIIRAESAQQNGFENIGIFAAAVVVGNVAGLEPRFLNGFAGAYVLSRMVYIWVYINNTTAAMTRVRTTVYFSGVFCCMVLFLAAGNKMR